MVLDKTWSSSLESSVETDFTDLVAEVKAAVEAVEFDVGASSFTSVDVTGFAQVADASRRKRRETGDVEATVDIYFTATTEVKESEAEAANKDDATFDDTVTGIEEAVQDALTAGDVDILAADVTEVESDIVLVDEEEEDFEVSATIAAEYEQTKEYPTDPTATCDDPVEIDLVDNSLEAPVGCDAAEEVSNAADDAATAINSAIADSAIATGEAAVGTKATVVDTFEIGSGTTTTSTISTTSTITTATPEITTTTNDIISTTQDKTTTSESTTTSEFTTTTNDMITTTESTTTTTTTSTTTEAATTTEEPGTTASSTTVSDTTTSSTTTSGTTTSGTTTSGTTTFGTTTSVSTTTDSTTVVITTEEPTTKPETTTIPETTTEFVQPPCESACTEDWSAFEPCSHECWSTQEEFETIRKVRFKCYNSDAETCYETARCFTEENKDETECRDIEEIATGLSVTDLEALNLDGLGVLNVFVDFKLAITEKWLDDYSDPNSIQFNVKAAKYTGIMKSWFLYAGTEFISLDAVSMTKVENGLECSQTGVPGVADEDALDALLEVTAEDITKNNPFIDTIGVDNRRRRDIDAAVTRALDQCEGSDLIVLHLRTRHQLVTTFDYNLVTERILRITGANSNATAFDADTIAQKTTDKLTENISTGKPQSTNGLNFRKFGAPRTTKQDVPILSQWSAWDDSGCPNGQSEKTRECVMNNAQTTPIDQSECANSDAVKNLENQDYVAYRECCTDRENYSEEDDTQCICMYPWSADENGECNTCIALRPMQFLCYISGEFDNPPKESSATTTVLSLIPLLTMLWLQLVN